MTVGELLGRISSQELTEWMAYYELEPWGSEVDDHRFGTVAATIANTHRDPKKGKTYQAEDFFPPRDTGEEDDIEASAAKWRAFVMEFQERGKQPRFLS